MNGVVSLKELLLPRNMPDTLEKMPPKIDGFALLLSIDSLEFGESQMSAPGCTLPRDRAFGFPDWLLSGDVDDV